MLTTMTYCKLELNRGSHGCKFSERSRNHNVGYKIKKSIDLQSSNPTDWPLLIGCRWTIRSGKAYRPDDPSSLNAPLYIHLKDHTLGYRKDVFIRNWSRKFRRILCNSSLYLHDRAIVRSGAGALQVPRRCPGNCPECCRNVRANIRELPGHPQVPCRYLGLMSIIYSNCQMHELVCGSCWTIYKLTLDQAL